MTIFGAEKFKKALKQLNKEQLQAVSELEGPVMVFAGPGTGKTQVLTLRIANLIYQGVAQPREILALTFTNSATTNMQNRLAEFIGSTAFAVNINTFHGFCQEIINHNPEYFIFMQNGQPVDDLMRIKIGQDLIKTLDLDALRPPKKIYHYLVDILAQIDILKRENVQPADYFKLVEQAEQEAMEWINQELAKSKPSQAKIKTQQKKLQKQKELGLIYFAYQEILKQKNLYDFGDMILAVSEALRTQAELLADCQEKYQYFLIDEYQDTNNSQDEIINLLASYWAEKPNVFVVGDPQQSIYRFQGANLANFLSFHKRYPQTQLITLTTGYRCSNRIYQSAYNLINAYTKEFKEHESLQGLHNFDNRQGEPIVLTACSSQDSEIINIVKHIQKLQKQGVSYEDMALIYRYNSDAGRLLEVLSYYQIPVEIEGGDDVLKQDLIKKVLILLRLLNFLEQGEKADLYLHQLLFQPWLGLKQLDVLYFCQAVKAQKYSLLQVILDRKHRFWQQIEAEKDKYEDLNKFLTLGEKLLAWRFLEQEHDILTFFHQLLTQSGLMTWIETQPEKYFFLLCLYSLERYIANWAKQDSTLKLESLLHNLDTMQEHNLKIKLDDLDLKEKAVSLTTAHKAKGREWDYVFIYGVNEGVWSNIRERSQITLPTGIIKEQEIYEKSSEEARLFFMALTRAIKQVFVSWHLTKVETSKDKIASQFVYSLQEQQKFAWTTIQEPLLDASTSPEQLKILLLPPPDINLQAGSYRYLAQKVKNLSMSASLLNDYLADTEVFIIRHLLFAPEDLNNSALAFGNSMHKALEKAVKEKLTQGYYLPLEQILAFFSQDFLAKNLNDLEKKAYHQYGLESLKTYYQNFFASPQAIMPLYSEYKIGYGQPLYYQNIPLRGKIDRIDLLNKEKKEVVVIDYKTGKSKRNNEIVGKTALQKLSEREKALPLALRTASKRQLLFYKLLAELDQTFNYQVTKGVLDFVQVTPEQKASQVEIVLLDEEVKLLQELIVQVWQEIQTLKFLPPELLPQTGTSKTII